MRMRLSPVATPIQQFRISANTSFDTLLRAWPEILALSSTDFRAQERTGYLYPFTFRSRLVFSNVSRRTASLLLMPNGAVTSSGVGSLSIASKERSLELAVIQLLFLARSPRKPRKSFGLLND